MQLHVISLALAALAGQTYVRIPRLGWYAGGVTATWRIRGNFSASASRPSPRSDADTPWISRSMSEHLPCKASATRKRSAP